MLGAIIGDIAGSRFECNNYRHKDFALFTAASTITDDSVMTLAVAKAVMAAAAGRSAPGWDRASLGRLQEYAVRFMREIGRKYPNCGYGGRFQQWLISAAPAPYHSFGNGAAMRVSPAAFAAATQEEALGLAEAVTVVTHNHPEGIKGAQAVAAAIFLARRKGSKEDIRAEITGKYYPLDFTLDTIRAAYRFDATCQGSVPQAIQAFLEASSFEDTVRNAVSIGGDSDTIAAIAGSLAEAYYGIPAALKAKALPYLDPELRQICRQWTAFMRDNGPPEKIYK